MRRPRIVVIGDPLLDVDVIGSAGRLMADEASPIVDVTKRLSRPGGAGLTALLAARGGARVHLIGAFGADPEGERLLGLLQAGGVDVTRLPMGATTPVKERIRVQGRTVARLDAGAVPLRPEALTPRWLDLVSRLLGEADVVVASDYGRGLLDHRDVRASLELVARRIPIVWDPHPNGPMPVRDTFVATPNVGEARAALKGDGAVTDWPGLLDIVMRLARRWPARAVCLTSGPLGALLSYRGAPPVAVPVPESAMVAPPRGAVLDTCGAGDAFASALAISLARGAVLVDAVTAAVSEASGFVGAGAVGGLFSEPPPPSRPDGTSVADATALADRIRRRGGTVVATGGCFDLLHAGHVETLVAARKMGDCLIVLVNSDDSVRRLKGDGRPLVSQDDRVRVLAELGCVDAVCVFDESRPDRLLRSLRPDIWVKGGDYSSSELSEQQTMAQWGGQVVTVPYVTGRSTSALVAAARGGAQ